MKAFRFSEWAQPVVSKPWAIVCTLLFALSQWSGYRILNHAKHAAWQKACGLTVLLLAIGLFSAGCATFDSSLSKAVSQATTLSEQLHCGTPGAPAQPACLNDGQFKTVNADLAKVSTAGLAYTQILEAAQAAKQQPPATAAVTLLAAVSSALADIASVAGTTSAALIADIENALKKI